MIEDRLNPKDITVNRNTNSMTIGWNDGHRSQYPFMLLRAACPCASCRGGHENMSQEPDEKAFHTRLPDTPAIHINNVEAVGSYGLTILWGDGHHFGIYNWHFLRALCPCSVCRPEKG
ncbi:MAG: gamma-butyrobetaine hydroxylase-like domain-containing protein [Anaerolineaceae bacterium]